MSGACENCDYFGQVHHVDKEGLRRYVCFQCFTNLGLRKVRDNMSWKDTEGKRGDGIPRDARMLGIKPNQTVKVHILLTQGEEPYSYWSHFIKKEKGGTSVVCPGKEICPACADSRIKTKRTHAINVYDFESKEVKILEQGNSVMQQLKLIFDQYGSFDAVDITIRRIGEGLNTQYLVMPMPRVEGPFHIDLKLHDLRVVKQPTPPEKIRDIIDGKDSSTDFDPEKLEKEANPTQTIATGTTSTTTSLVISFGKYKGMTMDDIAKQDLNYVKWCAENIADINVKRDAQRVLGSNTPTPPPKTENSTKTQLISQAYVLINNDPKYKNNLQLVIEKMKDATASPLTPNGKMLLADYTEGELTKLISLLQG